MGALVDPDGVPMGCEDDDTAPVRVKVTGWMPRRASPPGARPFADAARCEPADLMGRGFFARLDLGRAPGNEDTARERPQWPGLRLCPPLSDDWTSHHDQYTGRPMEETMSTERVNVRVLLLFGNQAEVVADVPPAERAEPKRYPAAEIAAAVGLKPENLPGTRLTAEVGDDDQLFGWRPA